MNFEEKVNMKNNIMASQKELNEQLQKAKENNDMVEVQRINEKIEKNLEKIEQINNDIRSEVDSRTEEEINKAEADSLLLKGIDIDKKTQEIMNVLNNTNNADEDIESSKIILEELRKSKNRLRGEIYSMAIQKSGLNYLSGEISPGEVIKKHGGRISELQAEINRLQIKKEEIENKKNDINNQFEMATEKYKQMLEAGKISLELYEKRVANMNLAKSQDFKNLDDTMKDIDQKISDHSKEIKDKESYIEEQQAKFQIYDEYDKVYYKLFNEPLDKFAKERYEILKNGKNNSQKVEIKIDIPITKDNENTVNVKKETNINKVNVVAEKNVKKQSNESVTQVVPNIANNEKIEEKVEPFVEFDITSKSMFNNLYKKLSKGNISKDELKALTKVLENEDNFNKYGITTGFIFNKAKKILKAQGKETLDNIENFLKSSGKFGHEIEFDSSSEDNNILSHDLLKSWSGITSKLMMKDNKLSVENYINDIERYKESGNTLTPNQVKIYEEAIKLKENLQNYRKALEATGNVTKDRNEKMHNSVFYNMFVSSFGFDKSVALPDTNHSKELEAEILSDDVLDLSQMVNNSYDDKDVFIHDGIEDKDKEMER